MQKSKPTLQHIGISRHNNVEKFVSNTSLTVKGPAEPSLQDLTTGKLLQERVDQNPEKLAVVSRWQKTSLTYQSLFDSSRSIAQSLLIQGVRPGDHVVILAGNTIEYVQLFFAVGGIGSVFTIINPTFAAEEVIAAVDFIRKLRRDPLVS